MPRIRRGPVWACVMALAALAWMPAMHAATPAEQEFQEAAGKTPDLQRGAQLFARCAACHGTQGRGETDGSIPLIAGQHPRALIRQMVNFRHGRRLDPRMQHQAGDHALPDAQAMADVAAYTASLQREGPVGTGDGALVTIGRSVYAMHCAGCHGTAGEGQAEDAVPRLAGQHFDYVLRQFRQAREGSRRTFTNEHVAMLQGLDDDQLRGLADALARMK